MSSSPRPTLIRSLSDHDWAIKSDIARVGRMSEVPRLLRSVCEHTGMGFAAVARVTEVSWTACAVEDRIQFGVLPGSRLDAATTLCSESRAAMAPIFVGQFSDDPTYRHHPTPRLYHIESYVTVPILLFESVYFGNLCALDRRPAQVADARTRAMFEACASLIAHQLEGQALLIDAPVQKR